MVGGRAKDFMIESKQKKKACYDFIAYRLAHLAWSLLDYQMEFYDDKGRMTFQSR